MQALKVYSYKIEIILIIVELWEFMGIHGNSMNKYFLIFTCFTLPNYTSVFSR